MRDRLTQRKSWLSLRRARDLVDGGRRHQEEAFGLLPYYVAERTTVSRVSEVEIP